MASILQQIIDGTMETEHRGFKWTYTMPDCLKGLSKEIIYDYDKLRAFLEERNMALELWHAGLQNFVIANRGLGRPNDGKGGVPTSLTEELALELQSKIKVNKPNLLPDPSAAKTTKTAAKTAAKAVEEAGRKMIISFAQAGTAWDMAASIMAGAGFKPADYKDIYERALLG